MMAWAEDISVDINVDNDQIGVSFTKEDECLKRQLLIGKMQGNDGCFF